MPSYKGIEKHSGETWVSWEANPNYGFAEVWRISLRDFTSAPGDVAGDTVYTVACGSRVVEHRDGSVVLSFAEGEEVFFNLDGTAMWWNNGQIQMSLLPSRGNSDSGRGSTNFQF